MNVFRGDFIFGTLLLLGGASMLLRMFFNIDIPVFKLFFAALLIIGGFSLLIGSCHCTVSWESRQDRNADDREDGKF